MPNGNQPPASTSWLDRISGRVQVILTLLTALGTTYVAFQQQRLAAAQAQIAMRSSYTAETTGYADRLMVDVEKMFGKEGSDEAKKRTSAIRIDLIDAITNATSSQSGEGDRARLRHFPLWLALSSGNEEGLQLIGSGDRQDEWLALAYGSGDKVVRSTAMKVLRTNMRGGPVVALEQIFKLSDSLTNDELLGDAIESIDRVLRAMKRQHDPALENGNAVVGQVLVRLQAVRNSTRSDLPRLAPCKPAPAPVEPCTDLYLARDKKLTALLAELGGSDGDLAVATTASPPAATVVPATATASAALETAIKRLESDTPEVRRAARADLASGLDASSTQALIQKLQSGSASYRIKLGVAVAFQQSDKPIVLTTAKDAQTFVDMLGDPDATVRTNAAEFLMKVTDRGMFNLVRPMLESALATWSTNAVNPNLVYNSAVVLGTWVRVLPDDYAAEKKSIRENLETAGQAMKTKGSWTHTAAVIENLLLLAKA